MARERNKLSARKVASLSEPGMYGDGGGLWLKIEAGRRRWVYLFTIKGGRREMGLGGYPEVSLAGAREARDTAERKVRQGTDPIEAKVEAKKAAQGKLTFGRCADEFIEAKQAEWRNEKHKDQWRMTLRVYAEPLRDKPVDEIDTEAVLGVLQPIWTKTPETASRVRGRIENVLDAARARGFIPQDRANPARWRGHLDKLLAKRTKLTRGHQAAMPYEQVPAFVERLRKREAMAALCLELTILTACRSQEFPTGPVGRGRPREKALDGSG